MFSQNQINQRLKDRYGQDILGQPVYRVVWSASQVEKRRGEFEDYVPNTNILIRRVHEVREVKKYAYLDPQWILEKLMVNPEHSEVVDNDTLTPRSTTYEPIWSFGFEADGRPKLPVWHPVEFLIEMQRNPVTLTPSQMTDAEIDESERDYQMMMDLMNASIRNDPLHSAVKDGDAVMLNQDGKQYG